MREANIQAQIQKEVSAKCPGVIFRTNAGRVYGGKKEWSTYYGCYILKDPRPVKLLPEGFPDLLYFGPKATAIFVEVKTKTGKVSTAQERFHALLRKLGFRICVARTAEDAVNFINGGGDTGGPSPI